MHGIPGSDGAMLSFDTKGIADGSLKCRMLMYKLITVAKRSMTHIVFDRSNIGIVVSKPIQSVTESSFPSVCAVLCTQDPLRWADNSNKQSCQVRNAFILSLVNSNQ